MSREIKFRVWTSKNMFYQADQYLASFVRRAVNHITMDTNDINSSGHESYLPNGGEINEYLMQYTGLLDKNGKEIYESDIVAIDMWQGNEHGYIPEDGVIKWHTEASAFKWFSGDPSDANNYWLSQADTRQREVIGNIYENPELLEGIGKKQ